VTLLAVGRTESDETMSASLFVQTKRVSRKIEYDVLPGGSELRQRGVVVVLIGGLHQEVPTGS
jgi:hypothetical protein